VLKKILNFSSFFFFLSVCNKKISALSVAGAVKRVRFSVLTCQTTYSFGYCPNTDHETFSFCWRIGVCEGGHHWPCLLSSKFRSQILQLCVRIQP